MAEKTADSATQREVNNKTQDREDSEHQPMDYSPSAGTFSDSLPSSSGLQKPPVSHQWSLASASCPAVRQPSAFSFESFSSEDEQEPEDNAEVKYKTIERSNARKPFSDEDLVVLEETFEQVKNPCDFLITKLANELKTSEQKVLRWFSARRLKWTQEGELEEGTKKLPSASIARSSRKRPRSKSYSRKK